jgi:hypothetical protein
MAWQSTFVKLCSLSAEINRGLRHSQIRVQQHSNGRILQWSDVRKWSDSRVRSSSRMTVLTKMNNAILMKNAALNANVGFLVLSVAMFFMAAGMAFAGDRVPGALADAQTVAQTDAQDSATLKAALDTANDSVSEGSRLQVGMPIEQAIELLGGDPDSETEVGGACGMLDILTWDDDGTRIISVDGTVTSIVEDGTRQR